MTVALNIDRRSQIVDSLEQMLKSVSDIPLKEEHCDGCGLLMTHVIACFWLYGSDHNWEIPLTYCANCNPEVSNQRNFAA